MGILSRDAIKAIENGEEIVTYRIKFLRDDDGFVLIGFDKPEMWAALLYAVKQRDTELYEVLLEAFEEFGKDDAELD